MIGGEELELPDEFLATLEPPTPDGFCRCPKYDHLHPAHNEQEGTT